MSRRYVNSGTMETEESYGVYVEDVDEDSYIGPQEDEIDDFNVMQGSRNTNKLRVRSSTCCSRVFLTFYFQGSPKSSSAFFF